MRLGHTLFPMKSACRTLALLALCLAAPGAGGQARLAGLGSLLPAPRVAAGVPLPLGAPSGPALAQALLALRDSVYQNRPLSSITAQAAQARALFLGPEGAPLSPAIRSLALSRLDYLEGRALNESGDTKAAIARFESALEKARAAQTASGDSATQHPPPPPSHAPQDSSASILAEAQALSQLCSVKDVLFVIANGPKVLQLAKNILDTEQNGPKSGASFGADLILAQSKAFAPSIFGGDPAAGIAMLDAMAVAHGAGLDRDELFDFRICRGEALEKLGSKAEAAEAYRAALELYPGNLYAAERLRGIAP